MSGLCLCTRVFTSSSAVASPCTLRVRTVSGSVCFVAGVAPSCCCGAWPGLAVQVSPVGGVLRLVPLGVVAWAGLALWSGATSPGVCVRGGGLRFALWCVGWFWQRLKPVGNLAAAPCLVVWPAGWLAPAAGAVSWLWYAACWCQPCGHVVSGVDRGRSVGRCCHLCLMCRCSRVSFRLLASYCGCWRAIAALCAVCV